MKVEEQNKELMRTFFEAWGNGDYETLKDLTTPDYGFYFPSNSRSPLSREELVSTTKNLRKAFPDISWRMESLVADGDTVVFRFVQTGTHQGVFQGIPATGIKVECSGILISRISDGKVVEQREEFDSLGMMMQLGMALTPKEK